MATEAVVPKDPDAYEAMGRKWLGLGNISSAHWFCGLEPGGTDSEAWPTIWATRYSGAEVIDGRLEAGDPDHSRHFGADAKPQSTWFPLIRALQAFRGESADDASCLAYQRERFLAADGDEALLELSAYAARSLAVNVPREKYLQERIDRISELVRDRKPKFFLCYGTSRRGEYEKIVGGPFDSDGFRDVGSTVCAIVMHPTPRFRQPMPPEGWVALGRELRRRVDARE
jgi:hypothetical protein